MLLAAPLGNLGEPLPAGELAGVSQYPATAAGLYHRPRRCGRRLDLGWSCVVRGWWKDRLSVRQCSIIRGAVRGAAGAVAELCVPTTTRKADVLLVRLATGKVRGVLQHLRRPKDGLLLSLRRVRRKHRLRRRSRDRQGRSSQLWKPWQRWHVHWLWYQRLKSRHLHR